ncbi:MAG: peptide chain release factor 1 [Deltaproteobacteria bacterium]|nr:peptide chain release factor 1 [Deltaproteobacteria bacterium]
MTEQLHKCEARYQELAEQLAAPGVASDHARYQRLSRELAGLRPIVETHREHQRVARELAASRELATGEVDPGLRAMAREDVARLEEQSAKLEAALRELLLPRDPNDDRNVILEIRAGTGGEEAALFAGDLHRMYARYAEARGWKLEALDTSATDLGGFKEIVALVSGSGAYGALKYESGVHRVQRVPRTEASGRIHTSAVTVAVLPEADEIDIQPDEKDLKIDVFRASGPGGQGVNTTDSAVRITHVPSGIVVTCRDERSQHKNKAKAMKILRARLLEREQEAQASQERATRKAQVGSGDRSEKIRTYNFPQNRVTDHRIGLTIHQLDRVLDGNLEAFVTVLREQAQAEALK